MTAPVMISSLAARTRGRYPVITTLHPAGRKIFLKSKTAIPFSNLPSITGPESTWIMGTERPVSIKTVCAPDVIKSPSSPALEYKSAEDTHGRTRKENPRQQYIIMTRMEKNVTGWTFVLFITCIPPV
jgi:hypothetical protein